MSGYKTGNNANLYDPVTGALVGALGLNGQEQMLVTSNVNLVTGGISLLAGGSIGVAGEGFLSKTCSDVVSGTGPANGKITDTGQPWVLSGVGQLTTEMYGSYIAGSQNTYCYFNPSDAKISKVVQYFSGPMGTIAIAMNTFIADIIHVNFSANGPAAITYWKTGVGEGQLPKFAIDVANCQNLDDGLPHKLEMNLFGEWAFAYADGVLIAIAYDPNFPSITGSWAFAQIHNASDKIYGMETYSESSLTDFARPNIQAKGLSAVSAAFRSLIVGNPAGVGFNPISSSYFWTGDPDGHVFGGSAETIVTAKADSPGYPARFRAVSYSGIETGLRSGNDGVGSVQHQGADRIKFPFNSPRVDFPTPVTFPVYTVATLPAASVAYQRAFVSDALTPTFGAIVAAGGAVKVPVYSDGAAWKVG